MPPRYRDNYGGGHYPNLSDHDRNRRGGAPRRGRPSYPPAPDPYERRDERYFAPPAPGWGYEDERRRAEWDHADPYEREREDRGGGSGRGRGGRGRRGGDSYQPGPERVPDRGWGGIPHQFPSSEPRFRRSPSPRRPSSPRGYRRDEPPTSFSSHSRPWLPPHVGTAPADDEEEGQVVERPPSPPPPRRGNGWRRASPQRDFRGPARRDRRRSSPRARDAWPAAAEPGPWLPATAAWPPAVETTASSEDHIPLQPTSMEVVSPEPRLFSTELEPQPNPRPEPEEPQPELNREPILATVSSPSVIPEPEDPPPVTVSFKDKGKAREVLPPVDTDIPMADASGPSSARMSTPQTESSTPVLSFANIPAKLLPHKARFKDSGWTKAPAPVPAPSVPAVSAAASPTQQPATRPPDSGWAKAPSSPAVPAVASPMQSQPSTRSRDSGWPKASTPSSPAIPAAPSPVRIASISQQPPPSLAPAITQTSSTFSTAPTPAKPVFNDPGALPAEIVTALADAKARRAALQAQHQGVAAAARRALFELELSGLDLRLAEQRRRVTSEQLEKAQAGVLGVDFVRV